MTSWQRVVSRDDVRAVTSRRVIRHYRLLSRCSSRHVRITSRHVDAQADHDDIYAELRVVSESFGSRLRLQSALSRTYLCFNRRGKLVVKLSGRDAKCLFQELQTPDHFTEFRSVANARWYIGFSRRGRRLRADSWRHSTTDDDGDRRRAVKLRHRHERRRRQRSETVHRCRQFVKTQVTPVDSDDHAQSADAASGVFNQHRVDFQKIYLSLRAERNAGSRRT